MNPDIVHFWYNGDSTLTAFPQALKLDVAPAYFLFGVDPGIYQERQLKSDKPVTLSCVPVCWGSSPYPEVQNYFKDYFALGAAKGPQSSVSLLYYDYFFMYAKALEEVGSIDKPDAVVDAMVFGAKNTDRQFGGSSGLGPLWKPHLRWKTIRYALSWKQEALVG